MVGFGVVVKRMGENSCGSYVIALDTTRLVPHDLFPVALLDFKSTTMNVPPSRKGYVVCPRDRHSDPYRGCSKRLQTFLKLPWGAIVGAMSPAPAEAELRGLSCGLVFLDANIVVDFQMLSGTFEA